jgi:DNA-binding MarR family transcriptional regulator
MQINATADDDPGDDPGDDWSGRCVDALVETSKLVTAVVARSLAQRDPVVSLPQLRVLVLIGARGAANVSAVAEALGVNPSNASRTCERLVTAGLLDRRPAREDRRQVSLTLSPGGQRFIEDILGRRRAVFAAVAAEMTSPEQERLAEGLTAFLAAARRASPDGTWGIDGEHVLPWTL